MLSGEVEELSLGQVQSEVVGRHPGRDIRQAGRDTGRSLCVSGRKGEEELSVISIAVVRETMGCDDVTERSSIYREEEGSEDRALGDTSL